MRASSPAEFDVDGLQPERDRAFEFFRRLADAGKHDLIGLEAHAARDVDLPDGVGVRATAETVQQASDREVRVGLEGVMQGVRIGAEGVVQRVKTCAQQLGAAAR